MSMMLAESCEAPARVAELLEQDADLYAGLVSRLRALDPTALVTVARGSSDNVASFAAFLGVAMTGRPVASLPPSLVTLFDAPLRLAGQAALAISQSGRSPDVVETLRRARKSGALTVALVNDEKSPLADTAEIVLPQRAGPEVSVAATKTVITSLVATVRLVAAWAEDKALMQALQALPARLEEAARIGEAASTDWLDDCDHILVLARGLCLPVAQEVALKLKETCGLHAEAFSAAELRHGPREIVDKRFLVIALAPPGPGRADVLAAADELEAQGAAVQRMVPAGHGRAWLTVPEPPDRRLAPILLLQELYPLFARTAKSLGRDPDKPRTLTKVTETR